jgi:hypothetical protein
MMGHQSRTESLFYYFRLEEQIPTDHLLRIIDGHVDFSFVREQLKDFYSPTGRPSIDPEVLLRLLLIGYLYGITSERRLMDEVRMHLAYRWFSRPQGSVENRPCGVTSKPAIWDGPGRGPYLSCFLLIRQVCFGSPAPRSAFQDVTVMEQAVQHGGDCGAVTE